MASHVFEEYKRVGNDNYSIWNHYLRERNGQIAKCKKCSKEIKCVGGSTGALHTHLKKIHNISMLKRAEEPIAQASSSSTKITKFFEIDAEESLPAILARMTASDGLPFSVFCTSPDLRKLIIARGFNVPKSANSIRNMVIAYSHKVRTAIIGDFNQLKSNGNRVSLTFDEWTSVRNRRYLNINVHSQKQVWSLGLVRVHGSLPAKRCVEIIQNKLEVFGLSLDKDVVCITTDGAPVMKSVGRLITAEQQLCFAHAIQLAVISVLYKKVHIEMVSDLPAEDECETDFDDDDDPDLDDESNFESGFSVGLSVTDDDNDNTTMTDFNHDMLLPLIVKIRTVVRLFRKSPTKNDDLLQKYVKLEFGKEYSLILDSKTRWNSLLNMLERFNKLKSCVQKALIDLKSAISFSEREFNLLAETISALLPIKLTVDALCRADANLLTADAALNFMLSSLGSLQTALGNELKEALELRIQERRTDVSAVLQFLHNGYRTDDNRSDAVFKKLSKSSICRFINNLLKRLSPSSLPSQSSETDTIVEDNDVDVDDIVEIGPVSEHHMEQLMQRAIEKELAVAPSALGFSRSNVSKIRRDLNILDEEGGIRSGNLEICYNYLLTIPPTSVESERAFSSSGALCTKIRSRLADESIDALCFLRKHFNALKKIN